MKRATCTQKARSRPPKLEHHIKRKHVVHAIIMTVVPWNTVKIIDRTRNILFKM